jgi:hypothetical protein
VCIWWLTPSPDREDLGIRQVPYMLSNSRIDVELEDSQQWNTQGLAKQNC